MSRQGSPWKGPLLIEEVVNQLNMALFSTRADQANYEASKAETLRVAVWALNVLKQDPLRSDTAASTYKVLAQARAMWEPLRTASVVDITKQNLKTSKEDVENTLLEKELLDSLEEQGDVFSLSGGYWLPTPLRLVPITETQYLLVGGLPTHLLPQALLQSLHLHGSFRQIDRPIFPERLPTSTYVSAWQFQSLNSWLGPTPPTLHQLTQEFYTQELLPISQQGSANQPLEAYAAYVDKPQALRWLSLEKVQDGRYLVRRRTLWGLKQYSAGEIENHRLLRQSRELHFTDIRRLCYALDHMAKTPTRVAWEPEHNMLTMRSELPSRERKQMASIGDLRVPHEGYYPRRWVGISSQHMSIVDDMLQQLGIQVIKSSSKL